MTEDFSSHFNMALPTLQRLHDFIQAANYSRAANDWPGYYKMLYSIMVEISPLIGDTRLGQHVEMRKKCAEALKVICSGNPNTVIHEKIYERFNTWDMALRKDMQEKKLYMKSTEDPGQDL